MIKAVWFLLLIAIPLAYSQAISSIVSHPQPISSFKIINTTQSQPQDNVGGCSYTVRISTSCSSTRSTRDQISLAFGDAYGNQVYAPRLDDPSTRTFESCSDDTFDVQGPCTYQICYLYVYRSGYDGWKPYSVEVYGYNTRAVTFYYDVFVPANTWYGFNYCSGASGSAPTFLKQRISLFIGILCLCCFGFLL